MVNPITTFSAAANQSVANPKDYCEGLRKAAGGLEKCSATDLDRLFESITANPDHSASLVFVMHARVKKIQESDEVPRVLNQCAQLLSLVNYPFLEFINDRFTNLFRTISNLMLSNKIAIFGVKLLDMAVERLCDGNYGLITNLHGHFFSLCLAAKRLDPALKYLRPDILSNFTQQPQHQSMHIENVLLYFYYGGTILLALDRLDEAANFLEMCVCMPATAVSAIMIEAFKKLLLVNLLCDRGTQLPTYRSPAIQRAATQKCQWYYSLVVMYNDMTDIVTEKKRQKLFTYVNPLQKPKNATPVKKVYGCQRFLQMLEFRKEELTQEGNFGLARRVYEYGVEANIARLPQVFCKIDISKIAQYCRLDDTSLDIVHYVERYLQRSTKPGRIDSRTATVDFLTPHLINTDAVIDIPRLEQVATDTVELAELLQKCSKVVDLNPIFLTRSVKKPTHPGGPGGGPGPSGAFYAGGGMYMEDEGVVSMSMPS